jgi:drug/metabolite transporter (DMT)-like permease
MLQWAGIAAVLGGIVLLAKEPGAGRGTRLAAGVTLALVAALAFGLFVVGLDAAADGGVPWTIVTARATSTALALVVALAASVPLRPPARLVPALAAVGIFDTTANVLVAFATTRGSAGIVAVLSALYPVVTIVLARVVLGERLDRPRRLGGALALAGAAVVAAG